jgi:hypothetical protein
MMVLFTIKENDTQKRRIASLSVRRVYVYPSDTLRWCCFLSHILVYFPSATLSIHLLHHHRPGDHLISIPNSLSSSCRPRIPSTRPMAAVLEHGLRREEDDAHASALLGDLEARLLSTGNSTCGSRTRCLGSQARRVRRRRGATRRTSRWLG